MEIVTLYWACSFGEVTLYVPSKSNWFIDLKSLMFSPPHLVYLEATGELWLVTNQPNASCTNAQLPFLEETQADCGELQCGSCGGLQCIIPVLHSDSVNPQECTWSHKQVFSPYLTGTRYCSMSISLISTCARKLLCGLYFITKTFSFDWMLLGSGLFPISWQHHGVLVHLLGFLWSFPNLFCCRVLGKKSQQSLDGCCMDLKVRVFPVFPAWHPFSFLITAIPILSTTGR